MAAIGGFFGLTEDEAAARHQRGLGHTLQLTTSRSYAQIVRENVFVLINIALLAIGLNLIVLGRYGDALASAGLVLLNVVIGVVQEVRAKRRLDRIALLTRPHATVLRDGRERDLDPNAIVLGDVLVARPGDQILVDGRVVGEGALEVDESLLTGESDLIPKRPGDAVYSGSFCVAGQALYEAEKVGAESYASSIAAGARAFRRVLTPLQQEVNLMLRVLLLLAGFFGSMLVLAAILHHFPLTDTVLAGAVVAGLVPPGLFLMISVAYAMAAMRMAHLDALVQQSNAVESLSNVDVLCLDKTGTLTANRLTLQALHPVGLPEPELRDALGGFAASLSAGNRTSEAIRTACAGQARPVRAEVPFSSARKWSAATLEDAEQTRTYVLGAPEVLLPALRGDADIASVMAQVAIWSQQGVRVVLFAACAPGVPLSDPDGQPCLPADLIPLGVLGFGDEVRPEARQTLEEFAAAGIAVKIISGDNPQTVAALARDAGMDGELRAVSGSDLDHLDDAQFAQTAAAATIFGRVTPQQKERLVQALRDQGRYVAMVGDGVNDVLALKRAQLSIALQSGSPATTGLADIVLLNDSFAVLPHAFREGQRIRNGMQDILKLFLTRIFAVALLLLAVLILGVGFPFTPKQISILSLLTVGVPAFALAVWARPGVVPRRSLVRSLLHFVLPASVTLAIVALGVYLYYFVTTDATVLTTTGPTIGTTVDAETVARDAVTVVMVLCGLVLIVFAEPPTRFWVSGDELSGDWRPTLLAVGMLVTFVAILSVPALRDAFGLTLLNPSDYALIGALVIGWSLLLRIAWRRRLFDRFLNVSLT